MAGGPAGRGVQVSSRTKGALAGSTPAAGATETDESANMPGALMWGLRLCATPGVSGLSANPLVAGWGAAWTAKASCLSR